MFFVDLRNTTISIPIISKTCNRLFKFVCRESVESLSEVLLWLRYLSLQFDKTFLLLLSGFFVLFCLTIEDQLPTFDSKIYFILMYIFIKKSFSCQAILYSIHYSGRNIFGSQHFSAEIIKYEKRRTKQ